MFVAIRISAVGICTLITAFSSDSLISAVGRMLKLAAMDVVSVPQNPNSMPIAAMIVGSPPNAERSMAARCRLSSRETRKRVAHDHRENRHPKRVVTTTTDGLSSGNPAVRHWFAAFRFLPVLK